MSKDTIGTDMSKTYLDAFRREDQATERFENSARGFRLLIEWLGARPVARIVFAPTGTYRRAFKKALPGKAPLVKVHPLQARRFADACGTRAKTDAVDAHTLARMGAALGLEPDEPVPESFVLSVTCRSRGQIWSKSALACALAGTSRPARFSSARPGRALPWSSARSWS